MDHDRPFVGTTIIDFDMETDGLSDNNDLPAWLRDMINRALTATGLRPKRHVASEDALESLIDVDIDSLEDQNCPICYDTYERKDVNAKNHQDEELNLKKRRYSEETYQKIVQQNQDLTARLARNDINIESLTSQNQFNDPSLFFPSDEGSLHYSRFPIRNLSTLYEVTLNDQFPGYEDEDKINQKKYRKHNKLQNDGHIPVKMPQCDHIFGKSCVIEWLKNNVSCPLCRKEVEAVKEDDPKLKKIESIINNSFYNFNDQRATVEHLSNHSTDVFNPYRRPFNSLITPLTDSYMHQDWAIPYDSNYTRVNAREPNLVLPRRFPFPESSTHAFPIHRIPRPVSRNPENSTTNTNNTNANTSRNVNNTSINNIFNNDNNNTTNTTTTTTGTSNEDRTRAPPAYRPRNARSNLHIVTNQSDENDDSDSSNFSSTIQDDLNLQFAPITNSPSVNVSYSRGASPLRTGGPERSRRSGRIHPYERPNDDNQ